MIIIIIPKARCASGPDGALDAAGPVNRELVVAVRHPAEVHVRQRGILRVALQGHAKVVVGATPPDRIEVRVLRPAPEPHFPFQAGQRMPRRLSGPQMVQKCAICQRYNVPICTLVNYL